LALSVGVILSTSPNHEVYEVMTLVTPVWRRAASSRGGQSEIKLGVIPGIGGSQRLTRAIGKAKAMDLCLTGRTLSADEADAWQSVTSHMAEDRQHLGSVATRLWSWILDCVVRPHSQAAVRPAGSTSDFVRSKNLHSSGEKLSWMDFGHRLGNALTMRATAKLPIEEPRNDWV
jgi:enoyl-CoA hydratase/carnithine racemase